MRPPSYLLERCATSVAYRASCAWYSTDRLPARPQYRRGPRSVGVRIDLHGCRAKWTPGIDPIRAVKSFGQFADEVLVHLQAEGEVEIVVELRARSTSGFTEGVVRTVTENTKVLKFETGEGFEAD